MSGRTRQRYWVALAVVATGLLVALAVVGIVLGDSPADAYTLLLVGWPVVGALLVRRRHDNRVGKAMIVFAVWSSLATSAEVYVLVHHDGRALPGVDLAAWLAGWTFAGTLPALAFLAAAFPSGRIEARWMRWTWTVLAGAIAAVMVSRALLPTEVAPALALELVNPWALEGLDEWVPLVDTLANLALIPLAALIFDLARRWVRSRGTARLQMRWIAWTLLLFVFGLVVTTLMRLVGFSEEVMAVADTIGWLSFLAVLPLSIGIAVTRHRLYEIDKVISRTVTYGSMVLLLAAVYAAGVFLLRGLLPFEGPLPVAVSTLAVAALFNPLRRRVQQSVDRRFNRSRYNAERVADEFAGSLREGMEPERVVGGWIEAVESTMHPGFVGVWVRGASSDG